jgi:alanine-glyoxylate transaminase/serine-glyoxylate transaminase/serine-pyruvate transaminase
VSDRALERIRGRKAPVPFSFDIDLLEKYWVQRPAAYHHTMPILQYYALYEGIRLSLEEGLEARWARHRDAGAYFQEQMRARGFTFLSDPEHQLWELSAVDVPEGVDGKEVQTRFLREHGIEIGGGLGPTAPPIWRVGLMGVNANRETADRVLGAFDAVLPR